MNDTYRVGIPTNNRMFSEINALFQKQNIDINPSGNRLSKIITFGNTTLELYYLRSKDIPTAVAMGALDAGFTTNGPICENAIRSLEIRPIGFGKHRFVLAMKDGVDFRIKKNLRIATSYPNITRDFLKKNNIEDFSILTSSGSIEAYPLLDLADGIVDITQSGRSLRANNLIEVTEILCAETIFVSSKKAVQHSELKNLINFLKGENDE